jgi:hypothetical protein
VREPSRDDAPHSPSRRRRLVLAATGCAIASLVCAPGALASSPTIYVAAAGSDQAGANTCTDATNPCGSVSYALSEASSGGTIYVSGTIDVYNSAVDGGDANGISVAQDVTIAQDPAGASAVIQGPAGGAVSPGSLLTVAGPATVQLSGLTFQDGNADQTLGGAVSNNAGGDLTVTDCAFTDNGSAVRFESMSGGAIDNGDNGGSGTLNVVDSTFTGNQTGADAGAIDNADNGGSGTVTIQGSTFTDNSDTHNNGGAIDNGDNFGVGTMTITDSTFTDNVDTIGGGGAIDSGNDGGVGTLTVEGSTFRGNSGFAGGAIDSGNDGQHTSVVHGFGNSTLIVEDAAFVDNTASGYDGGAINSADDTGAATATVSGTTFTGNTTDLGDGGAIDSADRGGSGTLTVQDSAFSDNASVNHDGGAIDSGDHSGTGVLTVTGSTFSGNEAVARDGGAVDNADLGGTATATITDSTFSGNAASFGAALGNGVSSGGQGSLTLVADTLAGDFLTEAAGAGPEVFNGNGGAGGGSGTVLSAGDLFAGACFGNAAGWVDGGYNSAEDGSCVSPAAAITDAISASVATALAPLALNGGAIPTILIHADSPAFDLIPNGTRVTLNGTQYTLCATTDQRGVVNPSGTPCNAGATQLAVPAIQATLSSSGQRSSSGWWNRPVTVSFRCITAVALTTACPAPVTLSANAADQSVSETITGTDGVGSGSVTVSDIDIDQTSPAVTIDGPVSRKVYRTTPPTPTCVATAGVSGLASCALSKTMTSTSTGYRETVTATATSHAGVSTTATVSFRVDEQPSVSILGPRRRATYRGSPPHARCRAKAAASPVRSCSLTKKKVKTREGYRETVVATATSKSGITATTKLRFVVHRRIFSIRIEGPVSGARYGGSAPAAVCAAAPQSVPMKSCSLRIRKTRLSIGYRETVTATARSATGQTAKATSSFVVQTSHGARRRRPRA